MDETFFAEHVLPKLGAIVLRAACCAIVQAVLNRGPNMLWS
jgi:hypothetical protein